MSHSFVFWNFTGIKPLSSYLQDHDKLRKHFLVHSSCTACLGATFSTAIHVEFKRNTLMPLEGKLGPLHAPFILEDAVGQAVSVWWKHLKTALSGLLGVGLVGRSGFAWHLLSAASSIFTSSL